IEKVAYLDECVTNLKEELERKPTLEELAVYMGLTEDEVNDILRLTGEEEDDEDEEEVEE
ncbi:MAG: sigma-70 domain-containing protein, partial [Porphyromonadaceae bacterium]|nr:sigma-70 domain-containing protein [Porphyromonadaceae bacterium]